MEMSRELFGLIEHIWEGRSEGKHGWTVQKDHYVTIEAFEDDELGDYLTVTETDAIDALGYPNGEIFDMLYFDSSDFE